MDHNMLHYLNYNFYYYHYYYYHYYYYHHFYYNHYYYHYYYYHYYYDYIILFLVNSLVSWKDYPYQEERGTCMLSSSLSKKASIKGYMKLPSNDPTALITYLSIGPISIGLYIIIIIIIIIIINIK